MYRRYVQLLGNRESLVVSRWSLADKAFQLGDFLWPESNCEQPTTDDRRLHHPLNAPEPLPEPQASR
jgi:hypothetical protein